jgi:DNA-binding transcriptional ArsR family regulator
MSASVSPDHVFRALSDPTRREILSLLRVGRQSVGDLAANFDVSRPAISKHLRVLREARLVQDRPEGTSRMCELNAAPLKAVEAWLADYKKFWDRSLIRLKAHVEKQR